MWGDTKESGPVGWGGVGLTFARFALFGAGRSVRDFEVSDGRAAHSGVSEEIS
jgi:hypothetical protein